jgi:predicted nucleotidyltransferase
MRSSIFNEDFQDFIRALNECKVEYILVGGYSVVLHGYSRTTGDMDLWINPTHENYRRLEEAFNQFQMPLFDMTLERFLNTAAYDVFTFGRPPMSIEILTKVKGIDFDSSFARAQWFEISDHLRVRTLHLTDLIESKKAAGRHKDRDDLENLGKV